MHKTMDILLNKARYLLSSPTIASVQKLGQFTERLLAENMILQATATQLYQANKKKSNNRAGRPRLTKARVLNDDEVEHLWGDKALELDEKAAKQANKPRRRVKARVNSNNSSNGSGSGSGSDASDAYDTAEE